MTITLLMATTINGFVAGEGDDTSWVKDYDTLFDVIPQYKVIVMGKRTYEESQKAGDFPYQGALNIVMTKDKRLATQNSKDVFFFSGSINEVVKMVKEKGFKKLLIVGGGQLNGSFMKEGLINEIILDIHPYVLSTGIKLFENTFPPQELEFVESKSLNDGILQVRYLK